MPPLYWVGKLRLRERKKRPSVYTTEPWSRGDQNPLPRAVEHGPTQHSRRPARSAQFVLPRKMSKKIWNAEGAATKHSQGPATRQVWGREVKEKDPASTSWRSLSVARGEEGGSQEHQTRSNEMLGIPPAGAQPGLGLCPRPLWKGLCKARTGKTPCFG